MGRAGSDEAPPTEDPAFPSPSTGNDRRLRDRIGDVRSRAESTKRGLLERAEKERDRHVAVRTVFNLVEEDSARGGGLLAGGLAYKLFIWMLPAGLMGTSIFRLFTDLEGGSTSETAEGLGMSAALAETIGEAAAKTGKATWALLVIGLVLTLWASRGALRAFRLVSAIAWGIRPDPLGRAVRPALATAVALIALAAYGVVTAPLYGGSLITDFIIMVLGTAGVAALGAWAAAHLPHPEGIRAVWFIPGAIVFAVGLQILRMTTAIYFAPRLARVDGLYGALGFAAVFMTFLYLVARLMVLGFMTNAAVKRTATTEGGVDAG